MCEDYDHIDIPMVMIWCYMVQIGMNEQMTLWNQCVQNVTRVEEFWDIVTSV